MIKQFLEKVTNKAVLQDLLSRRQSFKLVTMKGILNLTEVSKPNSTEESAVTPEQAWDFLKGMFRVHRVEVHSVVEWLQDLYDIPNSDWEQTVARFYDALIPKRIKGHSFTTNQEIARTLLSKVYGDKYAGIRLECAVASWATFFYILEWHLKLRPVFNAPPIYLKVKELIPLLGNIVLDKYYSQASVNPTFTSFKFDELGTMSYEAIVSSFKQQLYSFIIELETKVVPPTEDSVTIQGTPKYSLALENVADACAFMFKNGKYKTFDVTLVDHNALYELCENVTFLEFVISRMEVAERPDMLSNAWLSDLRIVKGIFEPSASALYTNVPLSTVCGVLEIDELENSQRWLKLLVVRLAGSDASDAAKYFYKFNASGLDGYHELRPSVVLDQVYRDLYQIGKFGGTQIFAGPVADTIALHIEKQFSPSDPSVAVMAVGVEATLDSLGRKAPDEPNFALEDFFWLRVFFAASEIVLRESTSGFSLGFRLPVKQSRILQFETLLNVEPQTEELLLAPFDKVSVLSHDVNLLTLFGDIPTKQHVSLFEHFNYTNVVFKESQLEDSKSEYSHLTAPEFSWDINVTLKSYIGEDLPTSLMVNLMTFFNEPVAVVNRRIQRVFRAVHPLAVINERIYTRLINQLAFGLSETPSAIVLTDKLLDTYGPDSSLAKNQHVERMLNSLLSKHVPMTGYASYVYIEYNKMVLRAAIAAACYMSMHSTGEGKPEYKYSASFVLSLFESKETNTLLDKHLTTLMHQKGRMGR